LHSFDVEAAEPVLLGSIVDGNKSIAVMGTDDGTKFIRIGGTVGRNYRLESVRFKHAVFRHKEETITLTHGQYFSEEDNQPLQGIEFDDNKIVLSQKLRNYFREKEGLLKILMQVAAVPVVHDGDMVGFKLLEIDKGSIYDVISLRDRDIITDIDGTPLDSALTAIKALNRVKTEDKFGFTLIRAGVTKTFKVSVR